MEWNQPLLVVTPKAFHAVDINCALGAVLLTINAQMSIGTEHARIMALEPVGVDAAPASHRLDRQIQQDTGLHVWDNLDSDDAISLQETENRHVPGGFPSLFFPASAPSAKMATIFAALFDEQSPRRIFCFDKDFESLKIHDTITYGVRSFPMTVIRGMIDEQAESRGPES